MQAAQLAERLALAQYRAGTTTYLSVVTAQTLSLTNQRTAVQLRGRQLAPSVALVAATGGGWGAAPASLPRRRRAARSRPRLLAPDADHAGLIASPSPPRSLIGIVALVVLGAAVWAWRHVRRREQAGARGPAAVVR